MCRPMAHANGSTVYVLTQKYGGFLPDPTTGMLGEIAGNIARACECRPPPPLLAA
jgi:hypothetical protein